MDTVRFGRVLGHGARQAAKTLVSAVDAATAPSPAQAAAAKPAATEAPAATRSVPPSAAAARSVGAAEPRSSPPAATILPPSSATRPTSFESSRRAPTAQGLAEGSRRFGRAVWAPAVRLSGVLWLELTGVFFGLFALVAGIATWHLGMALFAGPASPGVPASDGRTRFFFAAGMVLVFGYFSLSSFLKANRRSRRP